MNKTSNIRIAWAAVVAYCLLIFVLSSMSRPLDFLNPEKTPPDWILHGVEYCLLGLLLGNAVKLSYEGRPRNLLFLAVIMLGVLYGLSDEWHQSFVPQREASVRDLLVDAGGVFLGAYLLFYKIKKKKGDV